MMRKDGGKSKDGSAAGTDNTMRRMLAAIEAKAIADRSLVEARRASELAAANLAAVMAESVGQKDEPTAERAAYALDEAAEMLSVSTGFLKTLVYEKDLVRTFSMGRRRLVPESELRRIAGGWVDEEPPFVTLRRLAYSTADTAQLLSLSEGYVKELVSSGGLTGVRMGGRVLVSKEEIERVCNSNREAWLQRRLSGDCSSGRADI